jgi:Cu/Ag efflux protein CusF
MKPLLLVMTVLLAACTQTPKQEAEAAEAEKKVERKTYTLVGEVVDLDPSTQVATIKHSEIKDFMEAMTMGFPVKDKAEYQKLKSGMKLSATLNVEGTDFWIEKIEIQP